MTDPVDKALALWGYETAACDFVAGRENRVYRVRASEGDFALRLRRPGYRNEAELNSELLWLDAMNRAGLSVPRPRPSLDGRLLETVDGRFVDMVGWLSGRTRVMDNGPLSFVSINKTFHRLGVEIARLHDACDAWRQPDGFTRCEWDLDGLLGEDPVWGRFWDNPTLDAETRSLLLRFRDRARRDLETEAPDLDYGLIHADLVRDNVLYDGEAIRLLDFDDGGFGFRLFEIATVLAKELSTPQFRHLKSGLLDGYRGRRPLDDRLLDLFVVLRAVTYVGWIVPRMGEDGAAERNAQFVARARRLCTAYLGKH